MSFENQGAVSERTLQLRNILYMLCKGVKGGILGVGSQIVSTPLICLLDLFGDTCLSLIHIFICSFGCFVDTEKKKRCSLNST